MENFNLTDEEQKLFAEWFSNLDSDKQAKLNFKNVNRFLSAYQIKDDDLEKIMNICGAKRLGHFGRSQFYIALKLIALAQNSYEISLENLNKPNLPLPRRTSFNQLQLQQQPQLDKLKNIQDHSLSSNSSSSNNSTGILLPPPISSASKSNRTKSKLSPSMKLCKFCNKNLIASNSDQDQFKNLNSFVLICPNCKNSNQSQDGLNISPNELQSSSSELQSGNELNSELNNELNNELNSKLNSKLNLPTTNNNLRTNNLIDQSTSSSDNSRCSSTELYETIDNSQAFEKLKQWEKLESSQILNSETENDDESKHCLLNEEDELGLQENNKNKISLNINQYDSINYFSNNNNQLTNNNNNSDNNDKIIEEEEDVFMMNDDQIKYYYNKFCQLLVDKEHKLLAGNQVKSFFEKSKLSLNDLKFIWNLSDLDNDGNLSIIEFCIAMHLIVLKRNKIPLPNELPITLEPNRINKLLVDNYLIDKLIPITNYQNVSTINVLDYPLNSLTNSGDYLDSIQQNNNNNLRNQHEITTNNSLTNTNNELNANSIATNKEIYSPNSNTNREWTKFNTTEFNNSSPFTTNSLNRHNQQLNNNIHSTNNTNSNDVVKINLMTPANFDRIELDPTLIHPLAVKLSTNCNSTAIVNKDRLFSKNSSNLNHPPFPPRPKATVRASGHARSSSLDLNRIFINNSSANFHQGAFINYRKHIQQQQVTKQNDDKPTKSDKQHFINYLKSKYPIPKREFTTTNLFDLVLSLEERNSVIECIYDELIDEFASTLERIGEKKLSNY